MEFDWDPVKNNMNIRKHGVDFEEAKSVFEDEMALEMYDENNSDYEDRFIIIGISSKTRELTVCHCYRNDGEITRIFSARRATKSEIALYERRF